MNIEMLSDRGLLGRALMMLAALGSLSLGCSDSEDGPKLQAGRHELEVKGEKREFVLRLPEGVSGARPLMVYLHGSNGSGDKINGWEFADKLLAAGFVVVAPDGADKGSLWPEWDAMRQPDDQARENLDLALFDALVAHLKTQLSIDDQRIYVGGHSAGGIMANRVLRERSTLLAGGIVGSGVFELTAPTTAPELDAMAVMVTWGGDNDEWGGENAGKTVPTFNFSEQSALASQHYEQAAKVNQVNCHGDNLGHTWLDSISDLLVDFLVKHPKGQADSAEWKLVQPAAEAKVSCSEGAASYTPPIQITCGTATNPDCQVYCQRLADCAVENSTVRPVLAAELVTMGFDDKNWEDCSGCLAQCDADVAKGGTVDETALGCIKTEGGAQACAAGIAGAQMLAAEINTCCKDQLTSEVCGRLCTAVNANVLATAFFPECKPFSN